MATVNEFQARKEASSIPDRNEHPNVKNALIFFLYLFLRNVGSPISIYPNRRRQNQKHNQHHEKNANYSGKERNYLEKIFIYFNILFL
jgi:hypothetical protein